MDWRKGSAVLSLMAFALAAAVGGAQSPGAGSTPAAPVDVQLKDTAFKPDVVMVEVNQTVQWTNEDSFAHDVTAVDGSFNSTGGPGGMTSGATFSHAFAEAGVYDYYCTVHSSGRGNAMWGRVIVVSTPVLALGGGGGEAAAVDPEEVGVKWLAHWVGIVSFLAVMVTLLVYYFVLKFGESIHTTDHRDRKEK